jgi:hypothetical protein
MPKDITRFVYSGKGICIFTMHFSGASGVKVSNMSAQQNEPTLYMVMPKF